MEGPAHFIVALFDVGNDFVEDGVCAAMGGDDGDLAAPGGDGFGDLIEHALILMESEFVELDVAAFAGKGVWVGGEAIDAATGGELEDVGGEMVFAIKDELAEVVGGLLEESGPGDAIAEIEAGLFFVARGDPDVESSIAASGFEDGVIGVGVG